jgi:hypothetical protein
MNRRLILADRRPSGGWSEEGADYFRGRKEAGGLTDNAVVVYKDDEEPAGVAQLAERGLSKPDVVGSTPITRFDGSASEGMGYDHKGQKQDGDGLAPILGRARGSMIQAGEMKPTTLRVLICGGGSSAFPQRRQAG